MNKKQYSKPEVKVVTYRVNDIIATSYHGPIGAPGYDGLDGFDSMGGSNGQLGAGEW